VRNSEVAVPDLAGWQRKRMSRPPEDQRFEIVPDWVCEILSPPTRRKDREARCRCILTMGYGMLG